MTPEGLTLLVGLDGAITGTVRSLQYNVDVNAEPDEAQSHSCAVADPAL